MNCNPQSTLEGCLHETSTSVVEEDEQACGEDASQFKVEERVFFIPKTYFVILEEFMGSIERFNRQAFMKPKNFGRCDSNLNDDCTEVTLSHYSRLQNARLTFLDQRRRDDKATWVFGEEMQQIDSNRSAEEVNSLRI